MWVIVLPSLGCTDDLASSAGEELAAIVVLEPQLGFLGSPPAVETYLQSVESGVFAQWMHAWHKIRIIRQSGKKFPWVLEQMRQGKFITIHAHHPSSYITIPHQWASGLSRRS